jgi:hypothetical protein
MKKETLEEASHTAWLNYEHVEGTLYSTSFKNGFIEGAKWQAKRMYSEKEVLEQLNHLMTMPSSTLDKFTDDNGNITMKWFEQFKNK